MKAIIALEDGWYAEGRVFGACRDTQGEVVFNTAMTGYQEIVTDPSYKGQMVAMTYPLIGNYGINLDDVESQKPQVEGFIIKELSPIVSNWRSTHSLDDYFKTYDITGIQGIDTRALTKHIRDAGAKKGVIAVGDLDPATVVQRAKNTPSIVGRDLVQEVTCAAPYEWTEGLLSEFEWPANRQIVQREYLVACLDGGIKRNILRKFRQHGFRVIVFPATTPAEHMLKEKPDGIFFSNGPGDPEPVTSLIETARRLIGKLPIFGICLGQQILGLALGGKTFKLKFGHRGGNQPVMDLTTQQVEITAQNHSFCVDLKSMASPDIELTHVNLNDQTLEGFRHKRHPLFCVQYHPESSPGPHDSDYLFTRFRSLIEEHQR